MNRLGLFTGAALGVALAVPLVAPSPAEAATLVRHASITSSAIPGVTCESKYVPTRDGTLLATDIYRSGGPAKSPVILERTPYGLFTGFGCFSPYETAFALWATHGYAAVLQEVRGTGPSEGTFNAVIQEINDQYDATEWAAAQSWSTGRVGTTGGSYLGIDQWAGTLGMPPPPHLFAIAPDIAASDGHDSPTYENGVFRVSDMFQYGAAFVPDAYIHIGAAKHLPPQTIQRQIAEFEAVKDTHLRAWLSTVPLVDLPVLRGLSDWYYAWLDNPVYDPYWYKQDVEAHYPKIKVPALIGGASIDLFNIGAIRNYQGMRSSAGTAEAREGTKLYWQAYGHAGDSGTPTFGDDSAPWATTASGYQLAFFDHYLKGINNGYERTPNAHIYVLVPPNQGEVGRGIWLDAQYFPLPGTREYRYYFGSKGNAQTRLGDGVLVGDNVAGFDKTLGSVGPASDRFTYDPRDPVPTVGGNLLYKSPFNFKNGFQDQSTVELRKDVLVYTSAPIANNMTVIGTVKASLWAATSAVDTDFTIKLVDVHPDGLTHNVMDRVVRARFRHGSKLPPSLVEPNKAYEYGLDIGNTASIFRTGHRIRVEISSSNFPKLSRNLNTAQEGPFQDRFVVAHQTILHDFAHPSFIDLPVAPISLIP